MCSRTFPVITLVCALVLGVSAELPRSGMVVYTAGGGSNDPNDGTMYRRVISEEQLLAPEVICERGDKGTDIELVISFDGKWLAFARSLGSGGHNFGGEDYHSWSNWDVYIARLDGDLPVEPIRVAHGFFPSWGDDSYGPTKTLYFTRAEEKAIYKATINDAGDVSNVVKHFDVPTNVTDLHMMASPDGRKATYRSNGSMMICYHHSGPHAGQKFEIIAGCHPSWCADSKWGLHARQSVFTADGSFGIQTCPELGGYHYGSSQDMKWLITRSGGAITYANQNTGEECTVMPMTLADNSAQFHADRAVVVCSQGRWVDIHVGDVAPPEVNIIGFESEYPTITPGASTQLSWNVLNASSLTLNGKIVTGNATTVSPSKTTTYTLVAEGEGGPVSAEIIVIVSEPVLAKIVLSPKSVTLDIGESVTIVTEPRDQVGNLISADIAWSLAGFGTLSSASGTQVVYTAPIDQAGGVIITASSGDIQNIAEVQVVDSGGGSTLAPKAIEILSTMESSYTTGEVVTLTWRAGADVSSVVILLEYDSGLSQVELTTTAAIGKTDDDWGVFKWVVPEELNGRKLEGSGFRLVVGDYSDEANVTSSGTFAITWSDDAGVHGSTDTRGLRAPFEIRRVQNQLLVTVSDAPGPHEVSLWGVNGKKICRRRATGRATHRVAVTAGGVYIVRIRTHQKVLMRLIVP